MTGRMRKGFTLLEIIVVLALAAILTVLVLPPIISSLIVVQREATMLNMFRTADQAMGTISSTLRPAVLPMVTDYRNVCVRNSDPSESFDPDGFQYAINSARGFRQNGCAWSQLFVGGSNFMPFAVPVYLGGTQNSVDADGMPFLGIVLPGGTGNNRAMGTAYEQVLDTNYTPPRVAYRPTENPAAGNARSLHRALSAIRPADFVSDPPAMTDPVHADTLTFPDANGGYAVIRFVPYTDPDSGAIVTFDEATMLFDLNEDGTTVDTFALGHLEIVFYDPGNGPAGPHPTNILTPPMVLVQLNTTAASYVPIFRLVNWDGAYSPGQTTWTPRPNTGGLSRTGYTLVVSLLLFDQLNQRDPLAFRRVIQAVGEGRGGKSFLLRRFESTVELRNMSRQ